MLNDKTTFTLTLGKLVTGIIAILGFAFTIGMTYQQVLPDRELQKKQTEDISDMKVAIGKISIVLEKMQEKQEAQTRDISALQNRSHTMNVELQLISSSIKEQDRERRKGR